MKTLSTIILSSVIAIGLNSCTNNTYTREEKKDVVYYAETYPIIESSNKDITGDGLNDIIMHNIDVNTRKIVDRYLLIGNSKNEYNIAKEYTNNDGTKYFKCTAELKKYRFNGTSYVGEKVHFMRRGPKVYSNKLQKANLSHKSIKHRVI